MAAGPETWAAVRAWVVDLLTDPDQQGRVVAGPPGRRRARPALRGRGLRRLLRLRAPRDQRRQDLPTRRRRTAAQLEASSGRLSRPGRARSWSPAPTSTARRDSGRRPPTPAPSYGPSLRLDIEAELGFVVGQSRPLGQRVSTAEFADTVFGVTGVNDWSARDIQAWEYVPLGPNLAKSFATSISAWVTPLAALEHARVDLPGQDVDVLPYLGETGPTGYDIEVEVEVNGTVVSAAAVLVDVLVAGADAGPPHGQRRLPARGGLLRVGHDLGPGEGAARFLPRALLGRPRAVDAPAGRSAPSSRTATRSSCATRRPAGPTRAWDWARCVARSCPPPDLRVSGRTCGDSR